MLGVARWEMYKYMYLISHLTHTLDKINCDTTSVSGQVPTYGRLCLPKFRCIQETGPIEKGYLLVPTNSRSIS